MKDQTLKFCQIGSVSRFPLSIAQSRCLTVRNLEADSRHEHADLEKRLWAVIQRPERGENRVMLIFAIQSFLCCSLPLSTQTSCNRDYNPLKVFLKRETALPESAGYPWVSKH